MCWCFNNSAFKDSQSIANLEIAIDQELFNREKNIPVLTSTGKALLPVAKSILDQQKYFDQKVESLAQEDDHELSKLPVVQDSDLKRYRQCVQRSSKQRELWFTYGISSMLWYANTHKTIIDLVEQNVGWANVPEMMVMEGIHKGELVALPVAHEHGGWITPVGCLGVTPSHQWPGTHESD